MNKWIKANTESLIGKTILITGSTGGLAKEFVKTFACLGANFIFANRNLQKTENQKQELLKEFPKIKIEILQVDMLDINSVKNLCKKLKTKHIDIAIFNSAIYNVKREKTSAGFDNVFQVNFISPYYIIKQILPQMSKVVGSKIIVIGSIAHNFIKTNFDDIEQLKNAKLFTNIWKFKEIFNVFAL